MKKYIFPLIIALILGFFMAKFMFEQYDSDAKLKTVFNSGETVYFFKKGSYESLDKMKESMKNFKYYIYSYDEKQYHSYIGLTKNKNNIDKIKGYFKEEEKDISVIELKVDNKKFIAILEQYDNLLEVTKEKKIIEAIISQVLANYEELVKE